MVTRPAVGGKIRHAEARRDDAHKHQQLNHRKDGDNQFKHRRQFHAEDIQPHKNDISPDRGHLRVKRRKLDIQVGSDGQSDRRGRKNKFNQRGKPGDQAAGFTKCPATVSKRSPHAG